MSTAIASSAMAAMTAAKVYLDLRSISAAWRLIVRGRV
jgi:hypothetical protein